MEIQAHKELSRWNVRNSVCLKVSQPLKLDNKRGLRLGVKAIKWERANEWGPIPARGSKELWQGQWLEVQKEGSEHGDDNCLILAQPLGNL